MNICARVGCDNEFDAKTHNQKYCGAECCRVATNERIMQKYYAKRDQKAGKTRFCKKCKNTKLSRYNDSAYCGSCRVSSVTDANRAVADMLTNGNWS